MSGDLPYHEIELSPVDEDYYSVLSIDKNATEQEVINAYRRLSKLYHPDKHTDEDKKEQAEILFNKIKRAYEVLIDPHKRAIYDTVGVKGVQTEGWMIIQRTKTPQEIRDEYEQLMKEKEEKKLQQHTDSKCNIIIGINATDVFDSYNEDFSLPSIEISSMSISQSLKAKMNSGSMVTLNGNLMSENGNGSGTIGCSIQKITSPKGWIECGFSGGNGLGLVLKGFRHISAKSFGSLQTRLHFTSIGIIPTFQTEIGRQLTKQCAGFLTWNFGNNSSVKTTVSWNSPLKHYLSSNLQFGLRSSFLSFNYKYKLSDDTKLLSTFKVSTAGVFVEYGCEKLLFQNNTVGATMSIGLSSGITLRLKLSRANQSYLFPILLSEEFLPSAVFYGTLAPIFGWCILKMFVINPQQEKEKKKLLEENSAKLAEKKKEALIAVNLMQETYQRIQTIEESKNGLLIIEAWYGKSEDLCNTEENNENSSKNFALNVKVQVQCLVKDSSLILPGRSKCDLPGFYDPCLGDEKHLYLKYSYKNRIQSITLIDEDPIKIPDES